MTGSRTVSFQNSGGFHGPGDQSSAGAGGGGKQERGPVLRSGWQELKLDRKHSRSLPGVNEETHIFKPCQEIKAGIGFALEEAKRTNCDELE